MYCLRAVLCSYFLGKTPKTFFLFIPLIWLWRYGRISNSSGLLWPFAIYLHDTARSSGWLSGNNYSASRQVDLVMKAGYLFIWNKELHHNNKENDRLVSLQRSQKRRARREVGGDTVRVWGRWWARSTRGSSCRDTGTSPSPSATGREAPPRISGTTVLIMSGIMRVRKSLQQQSWAMPW